MPCGDTGVTCTKSVSINIGVTSVKLDMGRDPVINEVSVGQVFDYKFDGGMLVSTGLFTVIFFDIGLEIAWDGGTFNGYSFLE